MSDKLDLSLDDIIKITKKTKSGTRGRGRGGNRRGTGGVSRGGVGQSRKRGVSAGRGRGGGNRRQQQGQQFSRSGTTPSDKWDHDMYSGGKGNRNGGSAPALRGGNGKLVISNLDYGVSDSDITELFSEFGALRRSTVHYDKSGRSIGTADVHFDRRVDAAKALKKYNGVPLDGRVMKIEFVDKEVSGGGQMMNKRVGQKPSFNNSGSNYSRGSSRGGGNRGRGRGRGAGRGGRQPKKEVSAEELDKQLDAYISNKMEED